jgi:hypothetical protein
MLYLLIDGDIEKRNCAIFVKKECFGNTQEIKFSHISISKSI